MIIETAWQNYKKANDKYEAMKKHEGYGNWLGIAKRSTSIALAILIIALIVTFIFIPFAIFFTIRCGRIRKWPAWFQAILIFSFFMPYLGGLTTIFMLIYGLICYVQEK